MEFIKSPIVMVVVALLMLVLGFVLPFLMMMRILESTILLNFVAYLVSVFGLVLGIVGASSYTRRADKENDGRNYWSN
jgi:uncharacterized membrane protein (DUF485 family)